ncbi:MAG: FtsH protease activity modulator HflK [Calditrichaceae bacterium]|nr:FtsH protease activity modulator HflK [Calditrichaceae bacterium]MBN2710165.1 FtsH protease activity modulator HflK [Calditrichaceae bacterium]RQV94141.1 MAG: FtsH protease activity modulator HflK [Calditrichota bacterium]
MAQQKEFDLSNLRPPNISIRKITIAIVGFLIIVFVYSSWFIVDREEVAIVQRFGKYVRTAENGLNFKLPYPIEKYTKVPIEEQLKEEFGFRTLRAGIRSEYEQGDFLEESLMMTGDLNLVVVEWIVQYRIKEPYQFLFKVREAQRTFRDINEAVMREIVGDRTENEVITVGRQEIAFAVEEKVQALCDIYETGIRVDQIILQDVNPPDEVRPSFNEVNEAEQEKDKLINQAKTEYNRVIPKASGEAQRQIEEARGYALERVNQAKGEASRFTSLYNEYAKAREVTRRRIYLETMNEILSKVGKKLITEEDASGILPLFNFNEGGQVK